MRPAGSDEAPGLTKGAIGARLRSLGLRTTAARVLVVRCLHAMAGPVSHGELARRLAAQGLDRATLYRNLTDLTRVGLVSRIDLGDHVWRYELRWHDGQPPHHRATSHPHFVCVDCGEVACLPDTRVQVSVGPRAPRGLDGADIEIHLKGRCDACV